MAKPLHRLIVIGYMGTKIAYLDMPRAEALQRYQEEEGDLPPTEYIEEFEFVESFWCYDAKPLGSA